eukprot:75740_1
MAGSFCIIWMLILFVSESSKHHNKKHNKHKGAENVIIFIADGLGPNYNTLYRQYSGLKSTILDDYMVGISSQSVIVTDSESSVDRQCSISISILYRNTNSTKLGWC